MPLSTSAGTTADSQTRSVSQDARRPCAEDVLELRGQRNELADPVAVRDRGEHRLGVAAAEELHLAARHHLAQEQHVARVALEQVVEQRAAEVRREPELRKAVQGLEERAIAEVVRLVQHLREVPGGLVRVHAEEQRRLHAGVCSEARRIVPPSSGCPVPWLIGSASDAGTGSLSRR